MEQANLTEGLTDISSGGLYGDGPVPVGIASRGAEALWKKIAPGGVGERVSQGSDNSTPFMDKKEKESIIAKVKKWEIPSKYFQFLTGNARDFLKNFGIATTYNYSMAINVPGSTDPKDEGTLLAEPKKLGFLYNVHSIQLPQLGYTFSVTSQTDYKMAASLGDLQPLIINYWDYGDLLVTKALTELYMEQLDSNFALRIGYNNKTVDIFDNTRWLKFYNCALTRPKFGDCSFQNGLKAFTMVIMYEDYEEYFQ